MDDEPDSESTEITNGGKRHRKKSTKRRYMGFSTLYGGQALSSPIPKGGRSRKSKKSRKTRKNRKSRKSTKTRKSRKENSIHARLYKKNGGGIFFDDKLSYEDCGALAKGRLKLCTDRILRDELSHDNSPALAEGRLKLCAAEIRDELEKCLDKNSQPSTVLPANSENN